MFDEMLANYERELNNAQNDDDRNELINQIYEEFIQSFVMMDQYGKVMLANNYIFNRGKIRSFVDSDLMVTWSKYVIGVDCNIHKALLTMIKNVDSSKSKENARKIANETKEYILDDNRRMKINDAIDAEAFDSFLTGYLDFAEYTGEPIDENVLKIMQEFYSNLPEGIMFINTTFYKEYWAPRYKDDERIYNVYPKKSKEQYVSMLSELEYNGKVYDDDFYKYDCILAEYFLFYGDEMPYEEVERYFHIIDENCMTGEILSTESSDFFKSHPTGIDVMRNNAGVVFNDILRSYHNSHGRISALRVPVYKEIFEHMISTNPDTNRSYVEEYFASLSDNNQIGVRIANNLIKLKEDRFEYNRNSVTSFIRKIQQWSSNLRLYDSLIMNFDEGKLSDTSVDEKGLTKFDYADIALGLIGKENLRTGINEIRDDATKHLYERYGRDVYDSRAIRALVTIYVDKYRNTNVGTNEELERICVDFVRTASRKPGFNLFNDQECSDIVQLAKVSKNNFVKYLENEIRQGMNDNPEYTMSLEEAQTYVGTFLERVGERPIDERLEIEFDKFLKALSIMKINDERGVIPQEINEFLIRQANNENSIMNSKKQKYASVFERVVENYALNDAIIEGVEQENIPVYFTREVIEFENVLGARGKDDIITKRTALHSILDGKMGGLDTICHENIHLGQEQRKSRFAVDSYNEYMMAKEAAIMNNYPGFYHENYENMYIEIEAREKAAEKVVAFVDRVLTPKDATKLALSMSADIVSMFEDKYEQIKQKYSAISDKERENYQYAGLKIYKYRERTVHRLFDQLLKGRAISHAVATYPALECEYKTDGTKRTISEQLDFIGEHKNELKMPVMSQLVVDSRSDKGTEERDCYFYSALDRWIVRVEKAEDVDFVNTMISNVLPEETRTFLINTDYMSQDEGYAAYLGINGLLQKADSDKRFTGFYKSDRKGKTPVDMLIEVKEDLEKRFPDFSERISKEVPPYVQQYEGLRNITADVQGMKDALEFEKKEGQRSTFEDKEY